MFRDSGVETVVYPFDPLKGYKKIYTALRFNFWLYNHLRRFPVDCVHINDIDALTHAIVGIRLTGHRAVFNIRDVFAKDRNYGLKWILVNFCSRLIVLSNEMKEELLRRLPLFNRDNWRKEVFPIYSIVDFSKFSPIQKKESGKVVYVIYPAAFNNKKNQYEFIEKCIPLIKNESTLFLFAGDDDNAYGERCKELVKGMGMDDRVQFLGYRSDINTLFNASLITILPTRREGLARGMLESLASGVAVVSFDVSSAREILKEQSCGYVVKQGDYKSFAKAIDQLSMDQNLAKLMGRRGHDFVKKYMVPEEIVNKYELVYLREYSS